MESSSSDQLSARAQALIDAADNEKRKSLSVAVLPASRRVAADAAVYSPQAMVQLMVENPSWTHGQFALHFGRQPSWISSVLASQAFQDALDPHRHLVADPSLTATMEERFRMLALRAVTVLGEKLNLTNVSDLVVLKSAEIGVKALGMGQKAPEALPAPTSNTQTMAEKMLAAMDQIEAKRNNARTIDAETVEVRDGQ